MSLIEGEVSNFVGSSHFVSIEFWPGYWQCALLLSSYENVASSLLKGRTFPLEC